MGKWSKFKQWWLDVIEDAKASCAQKRKERLERESCESLQVMEFNGSEYISHHGTPIIKVDNLNIPATKALQQSRKDYIAWREKFC